MGIQLTPEEKFEVFGKDYQESWEGEAEQRWGDTDAWKESQRRTARYSKEDWQRIQAEGANSTVSGGFQRHATGSFDWVAGGLQEDQ